MVGRKLTPEQAETLRQSREARLARSVADVAEDIRLERKESDRLYIEAVAKGLA